MDSISQAALGAAIGESLLGKRIGNKGAVLGAVIATVPDLDVLLFPFFSKLEMLSVHRGFSHSILFTFIGATIISVLLKKMEWTRSIRYFLLWIFSWSALFTHILLDAFTAYGTQLFLPFSAQRIGFDSINVVDPVYTLPLLIGLFLSLYPYRKSTSRSFYSNLALAVSSVYLLITLGIKQQVNAHFRSELKMQNIASDSLLTMPVGIANINWYGVAVDNGKLYIKKYSVANNKNIPFEVFEINEHLLDEVDDGTAETMRWFAKGFYTVEKRDGKIRIYNLQVDMRGVVDRKNVKAPTVGYFELSKNRNGIFDLSSGSIAKQ